MKNLSKMFFALLGGIMFLMLSCKKDNNPASTSAVDITGTWNGTYSTSLIQNVTVKMILSQASGNVTGTFVSTSGASGRVSAMTGTIQGSSCQFTLAQTTTGCQGNFSGSATVTGDTLMFTFSGSDCMGTHENGRGSAVREKPLPSGVVLPLAINNEWLYLDSSFSPSHVDSVRTRVTAKSTIHSGGSDVEVFGLRWQQSFSDNTPDNLTAIPLQKNETGGLFLYGFRLGSKDTLLGKTLDLEYPVSIGDTWDRMQMEVVVSPIHGSLWVFITNPTTCTSTTEIFTTPLKSYSCVVYESTFGPFSHSEYYAPNVGLVGWTSRMGGTIQSKGVLIGYKLN